MNEHLNANDEARSIWDQNADFWDSRMGEGNEFHKLLIEPAQLELLSLRGGESVLDLACGNGQFARKMADLGVRVVGVDGSPRMIEHAKERSANYEGKVEFSVCDCTDREQLMALGERRFDAVVCTMALMDIAEIEPLTAASARLLKPAGRLVFSLLHPCFNSGFTKQGLERHDLGGELVEEYFVKVSRYSQPVTTTGLAMVGQPRPQYYFHRPLAALFGTFFAAGFVLDGLIEPAFGANANPQKTFDLVFQYIPPALVARFRLPPSA